MLRICEYILMAFMAVTGIAVVLKSRTQKKRKSILNSFERFLGLMIKQYGRCENISEAIDEAGNLSDRYMRRECGKISDALDAGEQSDKTAFFIRNIKEPFIKEFYSLCSSIRTFGDTVYEGGSLFDRNLKYIKEEVRLEILLHEEEGYLFSGLLPLLLIPFFLLIPIENWACGITADMKEYYMGSYGLITLIASFAVTLISIWVVVFLKNPGSVKAGRTGISDMILKIPPVGAITDIYIEKHYSRCLRKNEELKRLRGVGNIREFIIRQVIFSICGAILSLSLCFAVFFYERNISLRDISINEYRVYNMDEETKRKLSGELTEYFMLLKDEGIRDVEDISRIVKISQDESIQSACITVLGERLEEYYSVGFKMWYLFFIICSAVIGFNIPHVMLLLLNWQNELLKQRETLQFQTLILILMHHDRITVESILRWMEYFAGVFLLPVEKAVDDFSFRRDEALRTLKTEVSYEPLVRIVECLIACDDITVEQAFSDLESERSYNLEQYRQSGFDSLKERAAFARVIAFLPFVTVMALRLIIPFVLTGLSQLSGYSVVLSS